MNTVNYITPSDGDIYLVNNQTYVNSGGTDFDKIYNLSLIHISEPTRPY